MSAAAEGAMLLGNGAIARGLLEGGVRVATAYPGTPSTEILSELVRLSRQERRAVYTEWSVNEKVAFDVAFAASMAGQRASVSMKQVGLNVASDTLMSAAYTGVEGGFAAVVCDDPGPHSSQTEQDTRFFALLAKVPVLDPWTPREARDMARAALDLSERWKLPVLVRPTTRVCHARQAIRYGAIRPPGAKAAFTRDPKRWAATPAHRLTLHTRLNEKLRTIAEEAETSPFNETHHAEADSPVGVVAGGVPAAIALDWMQEEGVKVPLLRLGLPFPFPRRRVEEFVRRFDRVVVLEETMPLIEMQIEDRRRVRGRLDGTVPPQGELTPEVIRGVLKSAGILKASAGARPAPETGPKPPRLCPGCGHRPAFYAIRKTFRDGIFPSDIGCYTLGVNMKAVDTCIDMGASVTVAAGLYHAFRLDGVSRPIVATIGDSTFFHAGIPALINAKVTGARFVLVILDNEVVAMTGWQPTAAGGVQADGRPAVRVPLDGVVRGCGIGFVETVDPYDAGAFASALERARAHAESETGGVAVVIARHPCVLQTRERLGRRVDVTDACDGCKACLILFECPALVPVGEPMRVQIDRGLCTECGTCIHACPRDAIVEAP